MAKKDEEVIEEPTLEDLEEEEVEEEAPSDTEEEKEGNRISRSPC